jgi:hypothetical protein
MPTDILPIFSEEHDYSALEANTRSIEAKSKGRLFVSMGLAALAAGAGVGLAAFGLSFALEPKVITVEKPVVTEKLVLVDKPIITEKLVTVDRPVVVEKSVPAPQAQAQSPSASPPAPKVGDKSSAERFEQSEAFQSAEFHGRISSFDAGKLVFENGRYFEMSDSAGRPVGRPTTSRYNGDLAYCRHEGYFAGGREIWPCHALHKGVVENVSLVKDEARRPSNKDPLSELFNP